MLFLAFLDFVLTIHVGPRRHFVMSLEYVGFVGIVAVLQNNCITRCPFTGLCVQQKIWVPEIFLACVNIVNGKFCIFDLIYITYQALQKIFPWFWLNHFISPASNSIQCMIKGIFTLK